MDKTSIAAAGPLQSRHGDCPVSITVEPTAWHLSECTSSVLTLLTFCRSSQIEIHFRLVGKVCAAYHRFSEYYIIKSKSYH